MRSPVAISNGCAPVWASYSAIISFTSSMSAVAGSYSRSVLSPSDENVRILAFMVGLLRDVNFRFPEENSQGFRIPKGYIAPWLGLVKTAFSARMIRRGQALALTVPRRQLTTLSSGFEMVCEKKILSATHDCSQRPDGS